MSNDPTAVIRDALASAEEVPRPANEGGHQGLLDGKASDFYDEHLDGCPIQPLGVGPNMFYFIDSLGHFQEVEVAKLGRTKMLQMIGDSRWLWKRFPSFNKDGHQTGWKINLFSECLIDACSRRGSFDPAGRVRGAGMWQDNQGRIVAHCGTRMFVGRQEVKPGVHDGIVYPARAALPVPVFDNYGRTGEDLLEVLGSWNWHRGDLDAKMVMGFIAHAFLGGFTGWRPPIWISGDAGTGKSALQSLMHAIFGSWLLQSADASAAGLFQTLHYDCLPVALDELEPDTDSRKNDAILKLMRLSTSGATMLRGGQDGKAMGFAARSAFLFSSILTPTLSSAEQSRLAMCELGPVKAKKPLDLVAAADWGPRILGRLIQEAPRYQSTFAAYRDALLAAKHSPRAADQFGALGAGYDILTRKAFDQAAALAWAAGLPAATLTETAGYRPDAMNCLSRLLTSSMPAFHRGKTETLAWWLREAMADQLGDKCDLAEGGEAQRALASFGLRAWLDDRFEALALNERPRWIAVANSHEGTAKIFAESHWQTKPGATGVWVQALKRVPGAKTGRMWIDGATHRCVMIPWEVAFPNDGHGRRAEMDAEPTYGDDYEPGANG